MFEHFRRIDDPEILICIYKFLLARHKESSLKESVLEDFLKHLEAVFKDKLEYHPTLTTMISNAIISGNIRYYEDDLLASLVKACNIAKPVAANVLSV